MAVKLNMIQDTVARSWLASAQAPGSDFPIQNLPSAVLRCAGSAGAFRGGVAIGDQIVDLAARNAANCLQRLAAQAAAACAQPVLYDFMARAQLPGRLCAWPCTRC